MNGNIDLDEVEKFGSLAASWWDKDSEFKPLHDINPLRLNYIKEQCGGSIKGKRILDVGCGGGILCESLALEGAKFFYFIKINIAVHKVSTNSRTSCA